MLSTANNHCPFIVGITGGIATGKTTVTKMFAEMGVEIIDADVISRNLLGDDSEASQAVIAHFGDRILSEGKLDRGLLREIIFSDPEAKSWLEALMHPRIREDIIYQIKHSASQWLLLSVPLLLDNNNYDFVDAVIVLDTPEPMQISRGVERDNVDAAQVQKIMDAQMSREERLLKADHIIYNDSDLPHLHKQVTALYQHFENSTHARD